MKILLLGATGRTGKLVLEAALKAGHHVNCLSRNTKRITQRPRLEIFEGNPSCETDLKEAVEDCEAIIGVLNISRKSDFPWSALRTPKTYLSDVMRLLVLIAEKNQIQRISICSAWGVGDSRNEIPKWFKWFIDHSNIGVAYQDHQRQEELLAKSKLNWTIARPVGLTNSKRKEDIKECFENQPKPRHLISRKSLASYLIASLDRADLIHKKVVISKH